ncbi:MAG: F0F1 ATP synthase subunit B [Acutalibacteraceae bacterium]
MQTLDVISINIWQMLVSLANLVILFLLVKKFLYKPVKKMLKARQDAIDVQYNEAETARSEALSEKKAYEEKLSGAKAEADGIINSAVNLAKARENEIIEKAKNDASVIIQRANEDARLEMTKAEESIKREIVDVSTVLTSKLLEREINPQDHKQIIDSFIDEIGDGNDAN